MVRTEAFVSPGQLPGTALLVRGAGVRLTSSAAFVHERLLSGQSLPSLHRRQLKGARQRLPPPRRPSPQPDHATHRGCVLLPALLQVTVLLSFLPCHTNGLLLPSPSESLLASLDDPAGHLSRVLPAPPRVQSQSQHHVTAGLHRQHPIPVCKAMGNLELRNKAPPA